MNRKTFIHLLFRYFVVGLVFWWSLPGINHARAAPQNEIKVLALIPQYFGANTFFNLHNFDKMGWHLTSAGLTESVEPCSWFSDNTGVSHFQVDFLVPEITDITQYDVLALMSSTRFFNDNPYGDFLASPEVLYLVNSAVDNGLVVWATCAGVRVLAAADVINGKTVTGNKKFRAEYEAAGATFVGDDHPPVIDGTIVTSVRGNYYHHHITQAIAIALERLPSLTSFHTHTPDLIATDLNWNHTVWSKTIGSEQADGARDIHLLPDGSAVLAGYVWTDGNPDMTLTKVSPTGTVIWSQNYGGIGWEYGNSVCETPDNGFIIAGYSTSFSAGDRDIYIVKTNSTGQEEWYRTYGGTGVDVGKSICSVSSGGYAISGHTTSQGQGEDDMIVLRISEIGDTLWTYTLGGERSEQSTCVKETLDGNLIVCGAAGSSPYTSKNMDHFLMKLDASGNELWWKNYGNNSGEGFDFTYNILTAADGGFLTIGSSDTTVPLDFMQVKTDSQGNFQWNLINSGVFYEYGIDACEISDGFIIAGITEPKDDWNTDIWIIRTDLAGAVVSSQIIGGENQDWITSICPSGNGDVLITGHTLSGTSGNWDPFIARITIPGNSDPRVVLEMPSDYYIAGDPFYLKARLWNSGATEVPGLPLVVFLDVQGSYFFWPGWSEKFDYQTIDLRPGASYASILPEFPWPADSGTLTGIGIYAAMTNATITELYGSYDYLTFGWGNN